MRRIDAAIRRDMRDRLDSRGNLHLRPPGSVAWSEFRLRHACTSAGLRSPGGWHLTTKRPGHRKGTANPISSSLAYSLHENQCGSDCAVKNRASRPGKATKTFGDAGPKQDAAPPELWMTTASAFWRGSPVGASRHLSSFSCAANIAR